MPLILQLETATSSCSVAIAYNGEVIAKKELAEPNIHASHITLFIRELMQTIERSYADIDAIAVSMGPGSYTGLRIGVSTAKGLCYALDIPLIGIPTLDAMAYGMIRKYDHSEDLLFCPMIDARRMEVYMAVYDHALHQILPVQASIINQTSFKEFYGKRIIFFGDGAAKCRDVLNNVHFEIVTDFHNSASHFSVLAKNKYQLSQFEDVAYFEPFYLKDFVTVSKK